MLAGECVPYAKVGGLADVLGALPRELEKLGFRSASSFPAIGRSISRNSGFEPVSGFDSEVLRCPPVRRFPAPDAPVFLIGNDGFFGREASIRIPSRAGISRIRRIGGFSFSAPHMEFIGSALSKVDILHCHDHQAGLIPAYLQRFYRDIRPWKAGTVFTIHNMGYQGVFPGGRDGEDRLQSCRVLSVSPFEFYGMLNFMKVGVVFCGCRDDGQRDLCRARFSRARSLVTDWRALFASRPEPPIGILNGIDYEVWNPASDPLLAATYKPATTWRASGRTKRPFFGSSAWMKHGWNVRSSR